MLKSCAASVRDEGKDKGVRDSHSGRRTLHGIGFGHSGAGDCFFPLLLGTRLVAATFILRDILVKEKNSTITNPVGQERGDH